MEERDFDVSFRVTLIGAEFADAARVQQVIDGHVRALPQQLLEALTDMATGATVQLSAITIE